MKPIVFSKHSRQQMTERGVEESEVEETIRSGEELSAKSGRKKFRKNFAYERKWGDKFYRIKQVVPITVEEDNEIVVVTVYSFYF